MSIRRCTKQGQWYPQAQELFHMIEKYYKPEFQDAKFIIAPHAGLSYSIESQAAVYNHINLSKYKLCIILGVQHGYYKEGVSKSPFKQWQNPLDPKSSLEVFSYDGFEMYPKEADEDEHSIELLIPYLAFLQKQQNVNLPILPLYVGTYINKADKQKLIDLITNNQALLIVSSDFCHYGPRFGYAPKINNLDPNEVVDYVNNEVIQGLLHSRDEFVKKLDETKNTVCGRYTISAALDIFEKNYTAKVMSYTKSGQLRSYNDCNVSYVGVIAV